MIRPLTSGGSSAAAPALGGAVRARRSRGPRGGAFHRPVPPTAAAAASHVSSVSPATAGVAVPLDGLTALGWGQVDLGGGHAQLGNVPVLQPGRGGPQAKQHAAIVPGEGIVEIGSYALLITLAVLTLPLQSVHFRSQSGLKLGSIRIGCVCT